MVAQCGEDSYCHCFCDNAGLLGVFDGCGGAGARKHEFYSGKTEAYMASRLCAGAFYDTFRQMFSKNPPAPERIGEQFGANTIELLKKYQPPTDDTGFRIMGSMVRTLPTTAAAAVIQQGDRGEILVSAIWAGDSRVYILDQKGLAQLSVDDTTVPDPMENLYEDGVLQNLFCSDRKVQVHTNTVKAKLPVVVLTATDGCFGYVSTPMEFEGILLRTLLSVDSPAQWEAALAETIGALAGDDHTLCLASMGYSDFRALQQCFAKRYDHILERYLRPVSKLPVDDRRSRYMLWNQYRGDYMRYIKDGLK